MYFPTGAYLWAPFSGPCSPYWGGFGHFAVPGANGAGFTYPAYTAPFILQGPATFALKAGFIWPAATA